MTKVLTFENISYWYKTKEESILSDINYDFEAGVFYTVVGSSGSGKQLSYLLQEVLIRKKKEIFSIKVAHSKVLAYNSLEINMYRLCSKVIIC